MRTRGAIRIGVRAIARLIAFLVLAWQPSAALAQDEDTQLWINFAANTELGDDTRLTLDGSQRFRERARGDEQQTYRFTILHRIVDNIRIGGGAGVFETEGGGTELRPHQDIDLSFGRFSSRTRAEQRFFDGADRMELRLRQRIGYAQPLGGRWQVSLDGEYLHLAQTRERMSNRPRDEWRARTILSTKASERLTLGLGYMAIYTPRRDMSDRVSHIAQTHLTLDF